MHSSDTHAVCRGCGQVLNGKPYHMGGHAYHPETGKRCPSNHYGGFVCSRQCDWKASVEQLDSMPGCMGARRPSCCAMATINRNWPEEM